jgi:hypothetical protein
MITAVLYTRCGDEDYVLFNVFILNTLDVIEFKNNAKNSCEANLKTLPILYIRNVIKSRAPPPPPQMKCYKFILYVYLRYLLAKCVVL